MRRMMSSPFTARKAYIAFLMLLPPVLVQVGRARRRKSAENNNAISLSMTYSFVPIVGIQIRTTRAHCTGRDNDGNDPSHVGSSASHV
jgi:hypothetical protein